MNPEEHPDSPQQIAERAAYWLVTLQSEELTPQKRAQLIDWLRASPQHISELLRTLMLQRDLARFKGWHRIGPLAEPAAPHIVTRLDVPRRHAPVPPVAPRVRLTVLVAAGVVLVCALGIWLSTHLRQTVLATQRAERREVTLADGSVVDLAPDSEVVVRYRARERLLTLEHGEALFHAADNAQRPFIVQAAETRVRALGTVFDVRCGDQAVSVTVVEGRVSVARRHRLGASNPHAGHRTLPITLSANEEVTIPAQGLPATVRRVRSAVIASWASGELAFDNQTINDIVHRFNLYNRLQIRVLDPALGTRRLSGVFDADDPQSFVALVEAVTHAPAIRRNPDLITLGVSAGTGARPR